MSENVGKNFRTLYLEIIRCCMRGLDLPSERVKASYYTVDGMCLFFRYDDGKLYRIEVKEVVPLPEPQTTEKT